MSNKTKVAVLRGGPSSEYDISLITGGAVLEHLPEKYKAHDILIDKKGVWHREGMPRTPEKALAGMDVVINAMHGEFGEDGKVQQILDKLGVPYTGSKALASALGMNKMLSKKAFIAAKILTPESLYVEVGDDLKADAEEIFKSFPLPVVVKPNAAGSSVGISIARDFDSLLAGLKKAAKVSKNILIEQYIEGREATCGVIEKFRDQDIYSLLPIEIIPRQGQTFFDYESKYSDNKGAQEICPGNFDQKTTKLIQDMAINAHKALGMRHYSRSDFIVTPRGVYILEINSLPGLTPQSLLPKSLEAVASSFPQFLEHLIGLALGRV
jgi:D-alanine-D-alanine ligase